MKRIKLSNSLIIAKILFVIFLVFYLPDKIEFDNSNMYIVSKKGKKEVSLGNITGIAVTRLSLNNSLYLIKIKYYYRGDEYTARFYPRRFSKSLNDFKNNVRNKNPRAKVDGD